MTEPAERETLSVTLNPNARAIIRGIREDLGITNVEAVSRILESFAAMPRKYRLATLTRDEQGREELLLDWFREHMAARGLTVELLDGDDVAARSRQIRKLLDEIMIIHAGVREGAREAIARKKKG